MRKPISLDKLTLNSFLCGVLAGVTFSEQGNNLQEAMRKARKMWNENKVSERRKAQ